MDLQIALSIKARPAGRDPSIPRIAAESFSDDERMNK
jgi:hypothetical protein